MRVAWIDRGHRDVLNDGTYASGVSVCVSVGDGGGECKNDDHARVTE